LKDALKRRGFKLGGCVKAKIWVAQRFERCDQCVAVNGGFSR